jgi:hypothetical protein
MLRRSRLTPTFALAVVLLLAAGPGRAEQRPRDIDQLQKAIDRASAYELFDIREELRTIEAQTAADPPEGLQAMLARVEALGPKKRPRHGAATPGRNADTGHPPAPSPRPLAAADQNLWKQYRLLGDELAAQERGASEVVIARLRHERVEIGLLLLSRLKRGDDRWWRLRDELTVVFLSGPKEDPGTRFLEDWKQGKIPPGNVKPVVEDGDRRRQLAAWTANPHNVRLLQGIVNSFNDQALQPFREQLDAMAAGASGADVDSRIVAAIDAIQYNVLLSLYDKAISSREFIPVPARVRYALLVRVAVDDGLRPKVTPFVNEMLKWLQAGLSLNESRATRDYVSPDVLDTQLTAVTARNSGEEKAVYAPDLEATLTSTPIAGMVAIRLAQHPGKHVTATVRWAVRGDAEKPESGATEVAFETADEQPAAGFAVVQKMADDTTILKRFSDVVETIGRQKPKPVNPAWSWAFAGIPVAADPDRSPPTKVAVSAMDALTLVGGLCAFGMAYRERNRAAIGPMGDLRRARAWQTAGTLAVSGTLLLRAGTFLYYWNKTGRSP